MVLLPFLLALAAAAQIAEEAPEEDGAVPWQAQIYSNFTDWTPEELATRDEWDWRHRCGGTLIAPYWVLTAAHCIDQAKVDKGYRIRLGAAYLDADEGITYRIDRMVRHADWNKPKHLYDIALVHFVEDEETVDDGAREIAEIPLYDGDPLPPGERVYATGWGQLEAGKDKGFAAELTQVDLSVVECSDYPQYRGKTEPYMLCAAEPGNDTCTGDSGGPLVLGEDEPVLVGIVSWGIGCYEEHSAGVYVRIDRTNFLDWIDRAMAAEPSVNELR